MKWKVSPIFVAFWKVLFWEIRIGHVAHLLNLPSLSTPFIISLQSLAQYETSNK